MQTKQTKRPKIFMYILNAVILFSMIATRSSCFAAEELAEGPVKAVCAVKDIPVGKTIEATDVTEKEVAKSCIPDGVVSEQDAHRVNDDDVCREVCFYIADKRNVVGRISEGILAGETLLFTSPGAPGFHGTTEICARENIPAGTIITSGQLVEMSANPLMIPYGAISAKAEAEGEISDGIMRGQILATKRGRRHVLKGVQPGLGLSKRTAVIVTNKIPKGALITVTNVKKGEFWDFEMELDESFVTWSDALGRSASYELQVGQILSKKNVGLDRGRAN